MAEGSDQALELASRGWLDLRRQVTEASGRWFPDKPDLVNRWRFAGQKKLARGVQGHTPGFWCAWLASTVRLAEAVRSAEKGFAFSLEMVDESDL